MLLYEVTDALGGGGLFRDVVKPLDAYLSNGEYEAGRSTGHEDAGVSAFTLRDGVIRSEAVRRVPEAFSVRGPLLPAPERRRPLGR